MKTPEDEAFDELATRQGDWGSGFQTKPWNEDEWRRNNWRCGHGWLRGEQCEICNAAQEPPSEWAGIKAILDEYGLQAIDFVADFKAALAKPVQEPVGWMCSAFDGEPCEQTNHDECENPIPLYTTPPQREWAGLTDADIALIDWESLATKKDCVRAIEAKLKERNHGT